MGPWDHGSKGPDPFLQILGKCRTCINEILKFQSLVLGFFRRVLVFQDFSGIFGGVGTLFHPLIGTLKEEKVSER